MIDIVFCTEVDGITLVHVFSHLIIPRSDVHHEKAGENSGEICYFPCAYEKSQVCFLKSHLAMLSRSVQIKVLPLLLYLPFDVCIRLMHK